jgi:hypothetical protein
VLKLGTSRLNILGLAMGKYHINSDSVNMLMAGILVSYGYNRITSDDVVTCYNNIIAAHCHILNLWHNPTAHSSDHRLTGSSSNHSNYSLHWTLREWLM